jgi:replication-associated recombination protein RarA
MDQRIVEKPGVLGISGHEANWQQLRQLLQDGHLPHALAFVGPAGIGKRAMALALAESAGCSDGRGLLVLAPTSGSLKLEHAHSVLQFLQLRSITERRFIVIDDATTMNAAFANALLKILEEPPAGTHFIFVLPALSQLLPTLRSRLQVVRFFPLSDQILEQVSGASGWMVRAAHGSFASLEEWSSEEAGALKVKAIAALTDMAQLRRTGLEALLPSVKERLAAEMVARLFQQFFRDVLHLREKIDDVVHADAQASLQAWAAKSKPQILELWRQSWQLQQDIGANLDRSLCFENFFAQTRKLMGAGHAVLD